MDWWNMLFSADGRIRRRDFWVWMIVKTVGCIAFFFLVTFGATLFATSENLSLLIGLSAYCVAQGAFIAANVCLTAKRWHDRGKSGWMYLVLLIPIVGWVWTLIECGFLDGTQGRNSYGRSPKGIGNERNAF